MPTLMATDSCCSGFAERETGSIGEDPIADADPNIDEFLNAEVAELDAALGAISFRASRSSRFSAGHTVGGIGVRLEYFSADKRVSTQSRACRGLGVSEAGVCPSRCVAMLQ